MATLPRAVIEEVKSLFAALHGAVGDASPHHAPGAAAPHNLLSTSHGDADETDTPSEGQTLVYRSGQWVAEDPAGGGDAADVTYAPAVAGDWPGDADPGDVADALDVLADQVDGLVNATRTIILSAGGGTPTTTAGCADPAKVEFGTNDVDLWVLDFDGSSPESAFWAFVMPDNWNGGTFTATFYWTFVTGSGGVVWGIKARSYGDDDALDQAYGTEVTVADSVITAGDLHKSAATAAITPSGTPAGGELVQVKVTRKTADGSDTLANDARLIAVRIEYQTNAGSD